MSTKFQISKNLKRIGVMQYLLLMLFLFPNTIIAQNTNNNKLIDSAYTAYTNGKFEKAIEYYNSILNSGYESSEIYYNLANSYYKSNKLTLALVNYNRALLLAPGDEEIKFNLTLAEKHVVDKIDVLPRLFIYEWFDSIINIFSSNTWSFLSIGAFISVLLFLLVFFFAKNVFMKKISFWFAALLIIISIISFSFAYNQYSKLINHNSAIISSPTVTVKSSPDESGTDLFILHEGIKVAIEDSVKNWTEIELVDGSKGWIETKEIIVI